MNLMGELHLDHKKLGEKRPKNIKNQKKNKNPYNKP